MADTVRTQAALLALFADSAPRNTTTRQMIRDTIVSLDLRPGFAQADNGHAILIGVGAFVNGAQIAGSPSIIAGEGATAWGTNTIAIGTQAVAGQTSAKQGAICIGFQATINAQNGIRIGNNIAFGAGAGDDGICIGTQAGPSGNAGISIGRGTIAPTNCISIGHTASCGNSTGDGIAIGKGASCVNVGVSYFGVALGWGAGAGANTNQSAIAIGKNASAYHALGARLIAIGEFATITAAVQNVICIGAGATSNRSNECVIGDNAYAGGGITLFSLRPGAGLIALHRAGPAGWGVRDGADAKTLMLIDELGAAGETASSLYDVTAGILRRVSIGVADSGGAGKRLLRVPN